MIDSKLIEKAKQAVETASNNKDLNFFCSSRDILQARIDTFISNTKEYLASAVIGEIGNNTFDHNWEYKENHQRGAYFNPNFDDKFIVLADFGRGLFSSLKKVASISTDLDAIEVGFTREISGRAPEQRGNGLKFVLNTVKSKQWNLYYQSGNAYCSIENGMSKFDTASDCFTGCFAILEI